jgi:hypothetical protein
VQDSDELWTLSPPARRSLETLLRNSSDASVCALQRTVSGAQHFMAHFSGCAAIASLACDVCVIDMIGIV